MIRSPNEIDPTEAWVLLGAEVCFVVAVYFTADIVNKVTGGGGATEQAAADAEAAGKEDAIAKIHGIGVKVTQEYCGRMQAKGTHSEKWTLDPTAAGIYTVPPEEDAAQRQASRKDSDQKPHARTSVGFAFNKDDSTCGEAMMMYKDLKEVRV